MGLMTGSLVKLGAILRLNPNQIYGHIRRRLRNRIVPRFAQGYRAGLEAAAETMPAFAPAPGVRALAEMITDFYEAEYADTIPGCYDGRFRLMNKTVDFGSADTIDWRIAADEGARQIWRSNLSQMGYLPVAARQDAERALVYASRLVTNFAAAAKFENSGDFVEIWHPYIASRRVLSLLSLLVIAPDHLHGTDDWQTIWKFVRFNVAYVQRNLEIDLGFNHLERNLACLALFYLCCEHTPDGIEPILSAQFDPIVRHTVCDDGVPKERSGMYHALTIESFRIYRELPFWSEQQRKLLEARLVQLETALAALTLGDGYPVMFNDAWLGENPTTRAIIGDREIGFHAMPEGGYVRLAGQDWIVVMDAGPIGPNENPGHGHADYLSIEASVGAQRLIVDPGTLLYTAGALRNELRSWEAHNGPCIVGARPVTFVDSFKVGKHAAASFETIENRADAQRASGVLAFDAYRVSRDVRLAGDTLAVTDRWSGPGARQSRFLIPKSWALTREPDSIVLRNENNIVTLTWAECADVSVNSSNWSLYYRINEEAHEFVFQPKDDVTSLTFQTASLTTGLDDSRKLQRSAL